MFTGLVDRLGRIERVAEENSGRRLEVSWRAPPADEPLKLGESVAVNGCCLTIAAIAEARFEVQIGPETLARTNLGDKKTGERVNLERALKVGDRLGGHFVQGHIDTTAALHERRQNGEFEFLAFDVDSSWNSLLVPKGSIAVDGVSLTLVDVSPGAFSVMLIPHTLSCTTLGVTRSGDRVNLEFDILAKHVRQLLGEWNRLEPLGRL